VAAIPIDIPLVDESHDPSSVFTDVGKAIVESIQTLTEKSAKSMGSLQDAVLESNSASVSNKEVPPKTGGMKPSTIVGAIQKASAEAAIDLQGIWKSSNLIYDFLSEQSDQLLRGLAPSKQETDYWKREDKKKGQEAKNDKIWSKILNSKWFDKSLGYFKGFLSGMGDIFMDLLGLFIAMAIFDPSGSLMMSILQFLLSMVLMIGNMLIAILPSVIAMIPPIIAQFAQGLIGAIIKLVPMISVIIKQLIMVALTLIDSIVANLPQVLDALIGGIVSILTDPKILTGIMQIIVKLILGLATGIVVILKALVTNLPVIIENLVMALTTALPALIEAIVPLLPIIVEQLGILVIRLLPVLAKASFTLWVAYFKSLDSLFRGAVAGLGKMMWKYISAAMSYVGNMLNEIMESVFQIFSTVLSSLKKVAKAFFAILLTPFMRVYQTVSDSVLSLFNRLYQYMGPASMFGKVLGAIANLLQGMSGISNQMIQAMDLGGVYAKLKDTFERFIKWLTEDSAIGKFVKSIMDRVVAGDLTSEERDKKLSELSISSSPQAERARELFKQVGRGDKRIYEGINPEALEAYANILKEKGLLKDVETTGKEGGIINKNDLVKAYQEGNKEVVNGLMALIQGTRENGQNGIMIGSTPVAIKL
jgi:hypothetical protein